MLRIYEWVKNSQFINCEVSLCLYTESFICEFLFVSVEILKCKICFYQITAYMMIWSDFEFVIHLACIIKTRILDIIWPCLLIIMIMTWLFREYCLFIIVYSVICGPSAKREGRKWHYKGANKQYSRKTSCHYHYYQ